MKVKSAGHQPAAIASLPPTECEKASLRTHSNIRLWDTLVCLLLNSEGGVTERQQLYDKNITNVNSVKYSLLCSLVFCESQRWDQKANLSQVTLTYKPSTWPISHCSCKEKTAPFLWTMSVWRLLKLCFLLFYYCFIPSVQRPKDEALFLVLVHSKRQMHPSRRSKKNKTKESPNILWSVLRYSWSNASPPR